MKKEARILSKKEAEKSDIRYWQNKTHKERLETVQYLREQWVEKFHNQTLYNESRKGLRRVYKFIERK